MPSAQLGHDGLFVRRVPEREQEADRDRLRVDRPERGQVELRHDPLRAQPAAHPVTPFERNHRRRVGLAEPVEVRACLPSEVEEVLEAFVRHERRLRALPLEERVRRDGRSVPEPLGSGVKLRGCGHDRFLLPGSGRHLRHADAPVLDEDRVREGSADVDTEERHAVARMTP